VEDATEVSRLLRGTLPVVAALAAATAIALPANAGQQATGPARSAQWWLASLHVPQAWAAAPEQGAGVTVAVLSTGVDAGHQDLSGTVLTGPDYSGSGRTQDGPYWGFEGTAVAGLIAGHGHGTNGGTGSTGVAPRARILSVRVTLEYDDPLNSDSAITKRLPDAIAAGIRYAVDHGARVIALPLDPGTLGFAANGDPAAANGSAAERAAVAYAAAHDVVLVAPAGDNGANSGTVNYPAAYPGVLAVGATTRDGLLAPYTNTGSYVALTAPGTGLTVADPDGGYETLSSTDMSAALTAGVAALIRSRFPALTAAQVAEALERGTGPQSGSRGVAGAGHGALDAAGALTAAAAIAPRQAPVPRPTASPPRLTPAPQATVRRSGAGTLAGSLLRDAVIVVAVLIAGLAGALVLSGARRRRRAAAARAPRAGQPGGSHARRPRAALPAAPDTGQLRSSIWGTPGTLGSDYGSGHRNGTAGGNGAGPRLALPPAGSLGRTGRPRRGKHADTGEPPWDPAGQPGAASAVDPWAKSRPALPPAGRAGRGANAPRPPWELAGGEVAAAPVPADFRDLSNSGPMYIWNPAASGPLPILNDEDEDGR